jgi:hypothetical protein
MSILNASDLLAERRRVFVAARGGISLPFAGAIYWIVVGVLGYSLAPKDWALAALYMSGAIFPLGLILQGVFKSRFMKVKSPLGGASMAAIIAINLMWPLHFVIYALDPVALGLSLAIGMTLHWPVIGWSYASKVCYLHAGARIAGVTAVWIAFPDERMTLLPFVVAALYLLAVVGIAMEVAWTRRRIEGSADAVTA